MGELTTNNNVAYEEIVEIIEAAKRRFNSAKERLPKLREQLDVAFVSWRDGIIDGAAASEITKREKEIDSIKTQIGILEKLDEGKELRQYLKRNQKLIDACKRYERQQLEKLKEVEAEKIEAIKAFRAAREPFLKATRALGSTNCKASRITYELDTISDYTGRGSSYKSEYRFLYFPEVDIEQKFKNEWEGGCRDMTFSEPDLKPLYPEAQPDPINAEQEIPVNKATESEVKENV